MPRFGRIENGVVREIFVGDELFEMHPELADKFHIVPDHVDVWYTTDNLVDFAPPAPVVETPSPLDIITAAVKALPVAKRTNPTWGLFINQCLTALQYEDLEAFSYLVASFDTGDSDYLAIINQAKQLFGLAG